MHILASATASVSFGYTNLQLNSIEYNLNISFEAFTTDDEELPTAKQLLGLVTRDHNVDSDVKLMQDTKIATATSVIPTVSIQSNSTVTSPKVATVVTSVQVVSSPSKSPSPSAIKTAHPGQPLTLATNRKLTHADDSDNWSCSTQEFREHKPDFSVPQTFPSRRKSSQVGQFLQSRQNHPHRHNSRSSNLNSRTHLIAISAPNSTIPLVVKQLQSCQLVISGQLNKDFAFVVFGNIFEHLVATRNRVVSVEN
ncbi:hypothetical protein V3C99_004786 [Haemonchus contortus]